MMKLENNSERKKKNLTEIHSWDCLLYTSDAADDVSWV